MLLTLSSESAAIKILPENEIEEIAQNVRMILSTMTGSVPLDRQFGVDSNLVDLPIGAAQARMTAEIATAVNRFEPRAKVKSVLYSGEPADGHLIISATIEIIEANLRG